MTTLDERFNLRGKVAAVIGGAGHLCSALSRAMAESGMTVVILDMVDEGDVPKTGHTAYLRADVRSKDALAHARDTIVSRFGRVDTLLTGAGTNAPTPFLDISPEEVDRILGVNIEGVLFASQVFGEVMVRQRAGSIINFASASSGPPLSKAFVYSISKAGVVSITQNLAREWAPYNVRVNALRPGFFPTEWSMKHFIDKEREAKILGHTPMGRYGKPEELAGAVLWLASDAASFVTGAVVAVDGGFTAMTI